jgi:hypothetical protein
MKTRKKLLFLIGLFSILLTIYYLWATIPELADYASDAYLFQEPASGTIWKDWVLEAREMFWEALVGLVLRICFFVSIALWTLATIVGKGIKISFKQETNDEK